MLRSDVSKFSEDYSRIEIILLPSHVQHDVMMHILLEVIVVESKEVVLNPIHIADADATQLSS